MPDRKLGNPRRARQYQQARSFTPDDVTPPLRVDRATGKLDVGLGSAFNVLLPGAQSVLQVRTLPAFNVSYDVNQDVATIAGGADSDTWETQGAGTKVANVVEFERSSLELSIAGSVVSIPPGFWILAAFGTIGNTAGTAVDLRWRAAITDDLDGSSVSIFARYEADQRVTRDLDGEISGSTGQTRFFHSFFLLAAQDVPTTTTVVLRLAEMSTEVDGLQFRHGYLAGVRLGDTTGV